MKIVVFGPEKRVGAWVGDLIVDLALASGQRLPADLAGLIAGGQAALDDATRVVDAVSGVPAEQRAAPGVFVFAAVQLHAPQVPGARIACAGGNFADHTAAMATKRSDMPTYASADLKTIAAGMRANGIGGFGKLGPRRRPRGARSCIRHARSG